MEERPHSPLSKDEFRRVLLGEATLQDITRERDIRMHVRNLIEAPFARLDREYSLSPSARFQQGSAARGAHGRSKSRDR